MNKMDLETWRQQEADLATLRADLDAKTADLAAALRQQAEFSLEAMRLREALDRIYHLDARDTLEGASALAGMVLSQTLATQREVERVRAMERVVEVAREAYAAFAWNDPEPGPRPDFADCMERLDEALDAYEQVVK